MCFTSLIEWPKLKIAPKIQLFDVRKSFQNSKLSNLLFFDFWDHQADAEKLGEFDSTIEINEIDTNLCQIYDVMKNYVFDRPSIFLFPRLRLPIRADRVFYTYGN